MTLRPRLERGATLRGTRRGIEPLSLHRQWSCDASRITGNRVTDGNRTRLRRVTACPRPRRVPSPYSHSGSPWSRTTFSRASTERYHSTSSRPVPAGVRTPHRPLEGRASWPLDDRAIRSPRPGSNRNLPLTRRVLVRSSSAGPLAPAEGIEPSREPVNGRLPDHSASLE